jgi:hypothetical protein
VWQCARLATVLWITDGLVSLGRVGMCNLLIPTVTR